MKKIGEIFSSPIEKKILESLLPGGDKWHKANDKNKLDCKKGKNGCPYYCKDAGRICSDEWPNAACRRKHLRIMQHQFRYFPHYNHRDLGTYDKQIQNGIVKIKDKIEECIKGNLFKDEGIEGNL